MVGATPPSDQRQNSNQGACGPPIRENPRFSTPETASPSVRVRLTLLILEGAPNPHGRLPKFRDPLERGLQCFRAKASRALAAFRGESVLAACGLTVLSEGRMAMVLESVVAIALTTSVLGQSSILTNPNTITTDLAYPARLAPGPAGGIYVTDPPADQVLYFDSTGLLSPITYPVAEGPVGIAVHGDGRVFLARSDGRIGSYTAGFILESLLDPSPVAMIGPNDLAFDPDANWQCTGSGTPLACCSGAGTGTCTELFAVDAGGHRVLVFRESAPSTWTLARTWGLEGPGLGQYESPQAIALDLALHHVLVTDVDNFRVQVFDTSGIFLFKFGYRILYNTVTNAGCVGLNAPWSCCTGWHAGTCGSTTETAWFARSEGIAVDACSNIYIADALMGTVRVFDGLGGELDPAHQPVVGYGSGPDSLRVPCDVMINAGRLYVADTNDGAVETYDLSCTVSAAATASAGPQDAGGPAAKGRRSAAVRRSDGSAPVRAGVPQMPDNPAEIAAMIYAGDFREDLDMNRDRVIDVRDLELAVARFGAGTVEDFLYVETQQVAAHDALVPPHIIDITNSCGRCHSLDGAPGGMLTGAGQENLCQSCHSAGKIAGKGWIGPGDTEMNHPWGVPASDADPGPAPDSEVAAHLDAGKVRCGTCHDPHEASEGACDVPSPIPDWGLPSHIGSCTGGSANGHPCQSDSQCEMFFMRTEGSKINLCGECHVQFEEWLHAGHSEEHADPWSHYDWSMGNNWLCTGPGTPYAYCTDEGAGTAASAAAAACTGIGTPLACCTGPGVGSTCTVSNAACTGVGTPWACCGGTGTGNCANNLSAAACTGVGTPMTCCTGLGTGSCSSREACRQCHSGNGYIDFSDDFPDGAVATSTHRGTFRVVDCLVCHTTHGKPEGEDLLRIYDEVRLPSGQVLSGNGPGATCIACHNGRTIPPTTPTGVSTPHYLNGGAMLEGINGVTTFPSGEGAVAYSLTNSNHSTNTSVDCTTCHMAGVPTSGPEAGKVGGHTFNLKVHDPDDEAFGFENVANACSAVACHPGLTTFNRPADANPAGGDYDGDGTIEGVQDETGGMLGLLKDALYVAGASRVLVSSETGLPTTETDPNAAPTYPYWTLRRCSGGSRDGLACNGTGAGNAPFNCPGGGACNAAVPAGDPTATVVNAIWNWEYVDNSGDLGVKNTGYAIGLLQIAYKGVAGSAVPQLPPPAPLVAYRYTPAP